VFAILRHSSRKSVHALFATQACLNLPLDVIIGRGLALAGAGVIESSQHQRSLRLRPLPSTERSVFSPSPGRLLWDQYPSVISPPPPNHPHVLVTHTKEPIQPVRLYYVIPSKPVVTQILGRLRCTVQEPGGRACQWLYQNDAAALTFGVPYAEVAAEVQPVIIGRFKFPNPKRMVVEVRSIQRAIETANFFGPILGDRVVLRRTRVINRWFSGHEATGGLDRLDRHLDANVVVIDPEKTEADLYRLIAKFDTKCDDGAFSGVFYL